jgi:UDP-glucose 4-epimerase
MNILIIGSEGFIGSHLVKYFTSKGYRVYGCDLVEKGTAFFTYIQIEKSVLQWRNIFSQVDFNFCINAAGNGNVNYSVQNPFEDFQSNTLDTIEILDAIRKYRPECRYLHISSAAVYGNPLSLPVSESAVCHPVSPYGWHKYMAENICREYSEIFNLPVCMVRPFSIYGPGLRKQLFWDIYQKYTENSGSIELWGAGSESRDFIYIDDVVQCFDLLLQKANMQGEVYNVASGIETSISKAVETFFLKLKANPKIQFNQKDRPGDPLNWRADISKIQQLGFNPGISFENGMAEVARWLINYDHKN